MWDYESLRIVWWLVLTVLALGFALTAGFDLGAGMLLHYLGRSDSERRVVLNVIGPTWEGNQVWLIVLGGASFAAWPLVYAAAFSGLYLALMLLLVGLGLRPLGMDYRSKMTDPRWRNTWDGALFVGAAIPALVLSLAVGNLFVGLPFVYDQDFRVTFAGGLSALWHPFALLTAITGMALFVMHGAVYIRWRSEGDIAQRADHAMRLSSAVFLCGFLVSGVWLAWGLDGYSVVSSLRAAQSSPLTQHILHAPGLWLENYRHLPLLWLLPLIASLGAWQVQRGSAHSRPGLCFTASVLAVAGTVGTAAAALFPFIMPSVTAPDHSLTAWNASASLHTLRLLSIVIAIFLPLVLSYTVWAYRVIWGRVTTADIEADSHSLY